MRRIGCTDCHVQNLTVRNDRRIADVETQFDAERGIFNQLFATAHAAVQDGAGRRCVSAASAARRLVRRAQRVHGLEALVPFPPDDTASNLNPGVPSSDDPQTIGNHGSIALGAILQIPYEGAE